MGKHALSNLLFLLNLATLLITSLACNCPPSKQPPQHHPYHPLPPRPPHLNPPKPPGKPPRPPYISPPKPPTAHPPPYVPRPSPPYVPRPPVVPNPPPAGGACPIDTLKLGACVDLLGGLVHVGIGSSAKDTCCPVLQGLVGLDAAVCLCTTIRAKLLNINIILPIALQLLIDCGKTPPEGFKCPA
jgi:hypothetical protein